MKGWKGKLGYLGWFNLPWRLITEDGEIDLWPMVNDFFLSIGGKKISQDKTPESYTLEVNGLSDFQFEYIPGKSILMRKPKDFSVYNVLHFLDETLVWLSGRRVEVEIGNGKRMKFIADKSEEVFGVYPSIGNSCEVPKGAEQTVCKLDHSDCCIFLSVDPKGFSCEKFNGPMARMLLDRFAKNEINPRISRIGSCKILGRKE